MNTSQKVLLEVNGRAANSYYGLSPALFGKTTLQLCETRVVERTRKIVASRDCQVILSQVDSVEIVEDGISWLIFLGILTLFLGIGIIFLILYFFFKYKYLIISSGSNTQVLCISGANSMERAKVFMAEVLKRAEQAKLKGEL